MNDNDNNNNEDDLENLLYVKLLRKYDDNIRQPLIKESYDWDDTIIPVLREYLTIQPLLFLAGMEANVTTLKALVEAIYVMGYIRGKDESK